MRLSCMLVCSFCPLLAGSLAAGEAPGYQVLKSLAIRGEGGWDYLTADSQARRLYISRGTHVMVLDMDTERLLADIQGTPGVHGVALAPDLNRGFTSDGKNNTSTVFDLKDFTVQARVQTGASPDAILYEPVSKRVFTFGSKNLDATALDAATGEIKGTVKVGGKPGFAVADGKGLIYVNIEDTNEIAEIDSRKLEVTRRFSLKPGEEPTGLAIDVEHGRVFAVCHNRLMVVLDLATGKVLATVAIGAGVDGCAYDPGTGLIFSSNGEGTLTVVKETAPGTFTALETVTTRKGARTLALDTKTHRVYLATAEFAPAPPAQEGQIQERQQPLKDSFTILIVAPPGK